MIRGKNVNEALAVLRFTNKRAAVGIEKCVRSAIANATEAAEKANVAVDPDDLWVKACFVDMGAHKNRRRVRPAPQGRAYREQRHFHHITVLLSNDEKESAKGGRAKTSQAGKPATSGESKGRKAAESKGATKGAAKAPAKRAPRKAEQPAAKATTESKSAEQSAE
jgi:large subunit ribosomal protein L22